jgi:hypothetical protein
MLKIFYPTLTLVHIALLVWALTFAEPAFAFIALIIVQLTVIYDNAVVALGIRLRHGSLLEFLNRGRFLLHATCTALLLFPALEQTHLTHLNLLAVFSSLLFAGIGLTTSVIRKELIPVCQQGIHRYALSVNEQTLCPDFHYTEKQLQARALPPIQSILTVLVILAIGIHAAITQAQYNLLIASLVMLIAGGLPPKKFGVIPQALSEVVMLAVLIVGFAG